jgi:hypothetical protein
MAFQLSKETTKMPYYIVLIVFIATIIIIGGKLYLDQEVYISGIENDLVVSRLLFSEDCLKSSNLGEINFDNLNEDQLLKCSGISEDYGLKLEVFYFEDFENESVEFNKVLTSQCLIRNTKNVEEKYDCSFSKHYFSNKGGGILNILVVNEIK